MSDRPAEQPARPDAREVEEAKRWFRENPDRLRWTTAPKHAMVLVRAALAAGPDEPHRLGYRDGFTDGAQYARDIDRVITRMSGAGPESEIVEAARDGAGNGSWPPTARKVAEAFVALAGARPGPENQAEPRGLDERHRDELQRPADEHTAPDDEQRRKADTARPAAEPDSSDESLASRLSRLGVSGHVKVAQPGPDAEQAARPAGDDTADELRIALERIRDRVARGDEAWRWAQELARDTLAAHVGQRDVGQRDGGAAGDDTATPAGGLRALFEHVGIDTAGKDITVAGRVVDPAPASPTVFRADDGREWRSDYAAAAAPRAGADTAAADAAVQVIRDLWGNGAPEARAFLRDQREGAGRWPRLAAALDVLAGVSPAQRISDWDALQEWEQDEPPDTDSVPRAAVEALLAALDDIDAHRPQTVDMDTAVAEVRRHLDGDGR